MANYLNIQRKISIGVSSWLNYEHTCDRGDLFNEKYLSYPIGNILKSVTDYRVLTEVNHPNGPKGKKGRPLQIDFVLTDKVERLTWKLALESKWVGTSKVGINDIVWDLIRLQNLYSHTPDIKCYFVISGFTRKLKDLVNVYPVEYTQGKSLKDKSEVVNVTDKLLTWNLKNTKKSIKEFIRKQTIKYPDFQLYSSISCKPAHVYPKGLGKINENVPLFTTIVFEVLKPDYTLKVSALDLV